jgi:tRNA G10  N-methylase Trm11
MAHDLDATFRPASERNLLLGLADARQLPLPDSCVDAVVSSPPYLTRLDYAVSTAPELALLGIDGRSRNESLRRRLMGSTVTRGFEHAEENLSCRSVRVVLKKISEHKSKASPAYYRCFFENYFRDAHRLLREIARTLRIGGAAVLVVQDSWYKDIHIPIGQLFLDIAATVGLEGGIARSELVRQILTRINTQAAAYIKGSIHEHTLLVYRRI